MTSIISSRSFNQSVKEAFIRKFKWDDIYIDLHPDLIYDANEIVIDTICPDAECGAYLLIHSRVMGNPDFFVIHYNIITNTIIRITSMYGVRARFLFIHDNLLHVGYEDDHLHIVSYDIMMGFARSPQTHTFDNTIIAMYSCNDIIIALDTNSIHFFDHEFHLINSIYVDEPLNFFSTSTKQYVVCRNKIVIYNGWYFEKSILHNRIDSIHIAVTSDDQLLYRINERNHTIEVYDLESDMGAPFDTISLNGLLQSEFVYCTGITLISDQSATYVSIVDVDTSALILVDSL
jgi:hypothetical protein